MQSPRPGTCVLIAERDQQVRKLQEHFLGEAGFVVEFVDDGEAALQQALRSRPAVIVTEILIPKLDGLALCRRLGDDPRTRGIPVLIFSILAAEGRAGEAGAAAFLRKPLVGSSFVEAVQQLIETRTTPVEEDQWATK